MTGESKTIILVLGGGNPFDGSFPEHAKERVRVGINLYTKEEHAILLFSGNRCPAFDIPPPNTESTMMRAMAILEGISTDNIMVEEKSRFTFENALFSARMIQNMGCVEKVIVVTSDFHQKRAKTIFEFVFSTISIMPQFISSKTENLEVDNLAAKMENEQRSIYLFELFLSKLQIQDISPNSLSEIEALYKTYYVQ